MPELLCEGRCNGQKIVQAEVQIRQAHNAHPGYRIPFDENPYAGCAYTMHRALPTGRYACVDCGAERQYGAR